MQMKRIKFIDINQDIIKDMLDEEKKQRCIDFNNNLLKVMKENNITKEELIKYGRSVRDPDFRVILIPEFYKKKFLKACR